MLTRTFHLLSAIFSSLPFQKYFSKRTRDQKYNLHLITMKPLFPFAQFDFWGLGVLKSVLCDFQARETKFALLVCINLRVWKRVCLPRLLVSDIYQDFAHLAEKSACDMKSYTCHLSPNSVSLCDEVVVLTPAPHCKVCNRKLVLQNMETNFKSSFNIIP